MHGVCADQVAVHKTGSSADKEPFVPVCFGAPIKAPWLT